MHSVYYRYLICLVRFIFITLVCNFGFLNFRIHYLHYSHLSLDIILDYEPFSVSIKSTDMIILIHLHLSFKNTTNYSGKTSNSSMMNLVMDCIKTLKFVINRYLSIIVINFYPDNSLNFSYYFNYIVEEFTIMDLMLVAVY